MRVPEVMDGTVRSTGGAVEHRPFVFGFGMVIAGFLLAYFAPKVAKKLSGVSSDPSDPSPYEIWSGRILELVGVLFAATGVLISLEMIP